jgi:hypothetical protein
MTGELRPDVQLERVRRICLAIPETTEKEAWGEPTFRIRNRLFAMFANDHHRDGRLALWCNAPIGVQEHLVRDEPQKFFVPPYVGVKGWIGILLGHCDDEELGELVTQSYCMVAPRKLQRIIGR